MFGAQQKVPLYVPMVFLAVGVLLAWLNRSWFKDFDGALRRAASKRAKSSTVRMLGGSGDPQLEYEQLLRNRWMVPIVAIGYLAGVTWMLVIALSQL